MSTMNITRIILLATVLFNVACLVNATDSITREEVNSRRHSHDGNAEQVLNSPMECIRRRGKRLNMINNAKARQFTLTFSRRKTRPFVYLAILNQNMHGILSNSGTQPSSYRICLGRRLGHI